MVVLGKGIFLGARYPCRELGLEIRGRFRAKKEHLQTFNGLLPGSQGQRRVLTVVDAPNSLESCRPFNVINLQRKRPPATNQNVTSWTRSSTLV